MTKLFDAFISYGRADSKEFAVKLQARLNEQGFRVWFDFNDIPLAVDYQNQIDDGIEKACHFLFIISPHSVNSVYCAKEVELAIKRNKRIIPLLHVMQISQSTWQQRNPTGTVQDWEVYKQKGKHDSYQNMHPTIQKLNWVYFQEDKDDFEKSFANLINLLRSHTDYVEQHTKFLVKALEWERNQKQTRYLLTGEEKQQAEAWLKIRFKDEQPPCVPTDLHCEYITESIKNANNLMTQVFLSYADEDKAIMEKIRHSLRRNNITVWTNTVDIQTGEAFESAIKRGIEQADNIVYLLSPDSLKSNYCQLELDVALSLNKRIIPLLVRETDPMQVPNALRDLQYIDFTDNVKEEDYFLDSSQLLKILYEDAAYYNEHKILLTKALNWERQHYNPSILLRGYNLRSAEAWLKVAQKRTQHPPIQLQEKFINESLQQPPLESLDVFISYSRADSDLARRLNDSLQMQGKTTWFDQESIASGSDFQQEINRGIKTCDNFLFILSPRSVNSPYCKDEVGYASSLNKRFVTVLHQEINPGDLHPELAKVQWIDFNHNERDFNANFNQLVRTIDTDREHVQSHSKWLQRALEWEQKHKSDDLLLRGSEFLIAQKWFQETQQQNKKPAATLLQKEFIEASKKAIEAAESEKRRQAEMLRLESERTKEAQARLAEQKKNAKRQKFFLVVIGMAFVVATGLGWMAWKEQKKAQNAQLDSLSQSSLLLGQQSLKLDALLEAIRAGTQMQQLGSEVKPKTRSLILTALQAAVYSSEFTKQNEFKYNSNVSDVSFNPKDKTIATASKDGTIQLRSLNGQEIATFTIEVGKSNTNFASLSFSPDGNTIVSVGGDKDKTIKLWSKEGKFLETLTRYQDIPHSVVWSPDGNTIAANYDKTVKFWNKQGELLQTLTGNKALADPIVWSPDLNTIAVKNDNDKTVKLWSKEGKSLQTLTGHTKPIESVTFSPDGKTIATASEDKTIKLWRLNGQQFKLLNSFKYPDNIKSGNVSLSPDGNTIVFSDAAGITVELWSRKGEHLKTLTCDKDSVNSIVWSPDGDTIAASNDKTVILWDNQGNLLQTLTGDKNSIKSVKFSSDSKTIATTSNDNTVIVWSKSGKKLQTLEQDYPPVMSVAWSPDGNTIASGSDDNTVKLWSKEGQLLKNLKGHGGAVEVVAWSPDGNTIASGSEDNTVKLWSKEGQLLKNLKEHGDAVLSIAWSPDGNTIASGSEDNTVKLWDKEKKLPKNLKEHGNAVSSIAWSPDGNTIASSSEDKTVKLWNKKGELLNTFKEHGGAVWSIAWSPDGNTIASGSEDNTVKLWNKKGKLLNTFQKYNGQIVDVITHKGLFDVETYRVKPFGRISFSPDGKMLAYVSDDNTVKLWSKEDNFQTFKTLKGHKDEVYSVTFSPDGNTIASASKDNTVKLWNKEGMPLQTLLGHDREVTSVSFSPDGKTLASASYDKTVMWNLADLQLDNLVKDACAQVRGYLKYNASDEDRDLCKNN